MKPETKKEQKAREIAERKAAKEAAKRAEHDRVFATPIAKAVEPLRVAALIAAEKRGHEWVKERLRELESHDWNLNSVAPYPWGRDKHPEEVRRTMNARRNSFYHVAERDHDRSDHNAGMNNDALYVMKKSDKCIARYIDWCRHIATMQYEAFVYKMVRKVGDHTAAVLDTGDVWGYSHLTVTLPDGTVQTWRTQTIQNTSVHGKPFLQFPSRIVK